MSSYSPKMLFDQNIVLSLHIYFRLLDISYTLHTDIWPHTNFYFNENPIQIPM